MHDPMTLAFSVNIPLPWRRDKWTLKSEPKAQEWATYHLADIWHVDPCKTGFGGSDDTCGWFMRAHHGDKAVLERIVKRFEEDWDRTWTYDPKEDGGNEDEQVRGKTVHMQGYFNPNGMPRMSVSGITLNLFFMAAIEHFKSDGRTNWKLSKRFMRKHLFDIIMFAENPSDSLHDTLTLKYGNDTTREDRIRSMAATIYGWILRAEQPWYQHPRWHVHHWQINIHALLHFKRWAFSRCNKCGKGFSWGYSPSTNNWNCKGPRWFRGETDVYHGDCNQPESNCCADAKAVES